MCKHESSISVKIWCNEILENTKLSDFGELHGLGFSVKLFSNNSIRTFATVLQYIDQLIYRDA